MNCRNVKIEIRELEISELVNRRCSMLVTREAEDRNQKNVGWALGHAGFYLIFSSGSSVFIPKYNGILSGNAPVWACT